MKPIQRTKVSLDHQVYLQYVRKGNTIIIDKDSKGKVMKAYFAKRGLKKTKSVDLETVENLNPRYTSTSSERAELGIGHRAIEEIKTHLKSGDQCTVDMVKMTKSNGLPILISYDDFTCCWLIGTEKETIAVLKKDDIEMYPRYEFENSKQVAHMFFDMLKDFKPDEIESLKQELNGFTIVGEFIGDSTRQEIVRYRRPSLVFYARVPNNKNLQCYPPENAINFFEQHGLAYGSYNNRTGIKSIEEFLDLLEGLVYHIEESNLKESEEGALIFIVLQKKSHQKVLLYSTIKTLEFRLYKKLKDRLNEHITKRIHPKDQYNKFVDDIYQIVRDADLHHSINYYLNVADSAFKFCYDYPEHVKFLQQNFVSFLSLIINSLYENYTLEPRDIKDKKRLKMIENLDWYSYSIDTLHLLHLTTRERFKKKRPEKIVKTEQVELYVRKTPTPSEGKPSETESKSVIPSSTEITPALVKRKSSHKQLQDTFSPKELAKEIQKEDLSENHTAVLMPVSIPGFGISYFIEDFCKTLETIPVNVRTKVLDAHALKDRVLGDLKDDKNKLGIEEYINVSNDRYKALLETEVLGLMKLLKSHKDGLNLIIIKKHFNWLQAQELIASIRKRVVGDVKFMCLTTSSARIEENIRVEVAGKQIGLPFNHYMLMTSLKRQLNANKGGASQKSGDNVAFIDQTLNLACKFSNQDLTVNKSKEIGFDGFIGFPFFNTQNEETFLQGDHYKKTVSLLDKVVVSLLSKAEPSTSDLGELSSRVSSFYIGPEWWQLNDEEGFHTDYHHFVLRAVSSLLKKYKSLTERIVSGTEVATLSTTQQPDIQFGSDGNPLIPLNYDPMEIESNLDIERSVERLQKPIKNLNSVGKRRKPTRIGIYSTMNKEMEQSLFRNLSLDCISKIAPFDPEVEQDILEITKDEQWKMQEYIHVTVLYIGNQILTKEQDAIYNLFEPDQGFPFLILGIVYIPRYAIIGITKINRDLIKIEDKFDHVKIMNRQPLDDAQSSLILKKVFAKDHLLDHWNNKLNKMTHVGITSIDIDGQSRKAYVIPFRKKMLIYATTQAK